MISISVILSFSGQEIPSMFKNELMACAKAADGYYIDFTPLDSQYPNFLGDNDICHPTVEGHSLIADKICAFFDIKR